MECISHLQELQAQEAGDAILWATPLVLRAAREQMQQAMSERQALQVEAASFSAKLEELVREREFHKATLDRDADKARARVARQVQKREGLELEAAQVRERLAALEDESVSLEARREEAPRLERERSRPQSKALSADIESLERLICDVRDRLDLDADTQAAQEQIDADTARIELYKSDAQQYEELFKYLMRHDAQCADLRAQIDVLTLRRERQIRAAKKNSRVHRTRKFTVIER